MRRTVSTPHLPRMDTRQLLARTAQVTLVDAHGPPYFASGHLPGAVNIPPHDVAALAPLRIGSPTAPVVVYGASGSSNAALVAAQLVALGYADVSLYDDGLEGWIAAGLPVEATEPTVEQDLPPTAASFFFYDLSTNEIHTER